MTEVLKCLVLVRLCCFFDLLVVLVGTHASRVIDYLARKEPRGVVDVQVGGL